MISPVFWALLALITIAVMWWACQVDWSAWNDLYHVLPDRDRYALALLAATAALLALRGTVLLVIARDVVPVTITIGWLSATIMLLLVYYWRRG